MSAVGGSAFVGAVASDAWAGASAGLVRLFGRGGPDRRALAEELAARTAHEITRATPEERPALERDLARRWQDRLADLLAEYPDLREDLMCWTDEVRGRLSTTRQPSPTHFVAMGNATQYNAPSGSMTVNHHGGRSAS